MIDGIVAFNNKQDLLEIKQSPWHGLGVFAKKRIPKGTRLDDLLLVLENVPLACIKYSYPYHRINRNKVISCIPKSFGAYFNHSDKPTVEMVEIDKLIDTMYFKTLEDIGYGDELFITYGKDPILEGM